MWSHIRWHSTVQLMILTLVTWHLRPLSGNVTLSVFHRLSDFTTYDVMTCDWIIMIAFDIEFTWTLRTASCLQLCFMSSDMQVVFADLHSFPQFNERACIRILWPRLSRKRQSTTVATNNLAPLVNIGVNHGWVKSPLVIKSYPNHSLELLSHLQRSHLLFAQGLSPRSWMMRTSGRPVLKPNRCVFSPARVVFFLVCHSGWWVFID